MGKRSAAYKKSRIAKRKIIKKAKRKQKKMNKDNHQQPCLPLNVHEKCSSTPEADCQETSEMDSSETEFNCISNRNNYVERSLTEFELAEMKRLRDPLYKGFHKWKHLKDKIGNFETGQRLQKC